MSKRRDKDPQKSSPTSTSSEEPGQITAAYLPPPPTFGQPTQFQQSLVPNIAQPHWGEPSQHPQHYGPGESSAVPVAANRPTLASVRRPLGAAPLADILLQQPGTPTPSGSAPRPDFTQPSPISPQSFDLTPLRLHGEATSPERKRKEYYDPARGASEDSSAFATPSSQRRSEYSSQAGPSRVTQAISQTGGSSSSAQNSPDAARFSSVDRDRLSLTILQQPRAARACGYGERDRRVVDPPPILQLKLRGYDPSSPRDRGILLSPFNVVNCLLLSAPSRDAPVSACQEVTTIHDPNDAGKELRRLMGSLSISPFIGEDVYASPYLRKESRIGTYYIFSDISCRQNGLYRLRFYLMPLNMSTTETGGRAETVITVTSDVFEVFSAKDFPGMSASSELTKELKRQGASVPVKKGNESKGGKKTKKRGSDSDGSTSEGSDDAGMSKAAGKKPRS